MKVVREHLLSQLEIVSPGLSKKDFLEQSSCFAFKDGKVLTYNDEIAFSHECDLKIEGAIRSSAILQFLRKMSEEDLNVEVGEGELLLQGKRRKAALVMENEFLLPIFDNVTFPKKSEWNKLHPDFAEAVGLVHQCAAKDHTRFICVCVHIHPKWVEACDNFQLSRYKLKSGVSESIVVKGESIKHIIDLGMSEVAETPDWVHFRNENGLIMSIRRWPDKYDDLQPLLDVDAGEQVILPKGIAEATERAEILSTENADENIILVELRPGKIRIRSLGSSGRYDEVKKINYKGKGMKFYVKPDLLREITKRHNECKIAPGHLKVEAGPFTYVTCLGAVDDE